MAKSYREQQFKQLIADHGATISRVCYMYSDERNLFSDLYQETLINIWQGFDKFRGDANISTWIYRVTLNTCITYYRKNKMKISSVPLENNYDVAEEISTKSEDLKTMYRLISKLKKLDRAIIMLWLDEKTYDEISDITGLTRNNVASRLRRIKQKLVEEAGNDN